MHAHTPQNGQRPYGTYYKIYCFAVNQSIEKLTAETTEVLIPRRLGIWHYDFGSVLQVLTSEATQICLGRKAVVTSSVVPWSSSFLEITSTISKLLFNSVSTFIRSGLYVPWKLIKLIVSAEPTNLKIKMWFFSDLKGSLTRFFP